MEEVAPNGEDAEDDDDINNDDDEDVDKSQTDELLVEEAVVVVVVPISELRKNLTGVVARLVEGGVELPPVPSGESSSEDSRFEMTDRRFWEEEVEDALEEEDEYRL